VKKRERLVEEGIRFRAKEVGCPRDSPLSIGKIFLPQMGQGRKADGREGGGEFGEKDTSGG